MTWLVTNLTILPFHIQYIKKMVLSFFKTPLEVLGLLSIRGLERSFYVSVTYIKVPQFPVGDPLYVSILDDPIRFEIWTFYSFYSLSLPFNKRGSRVTSCHCFERNLGPIRLSTRPRKRWRRTTKNITPDILVIFNPFFSLTLSKRCFRSRLGYSSRPRLFRLVSTDFNLSPIFHPSPQTRKKEWVIGQLFTSTSLPYTGTRSF